jgi:hypothetical protein
LGFVKNTGTVAVIALALAAVNVFFGRRWRILTHDVGTKTVRKHSVRPEEDKTVLPWWIPNNTKLVKCAFAQFVREYEWTVHTDNFCLHAALLSVMLGVL